MLYAHYGNRIEHLADVLAGVLRRSDDRRGVFDPEVVVVNNAGMARWLQLRVAQANGIAANIDISFPAELVWRLLAGVLDDVPERNPYASESLAWRLFACFDCVAGDERYRQIANYLGKGDEYRQWSLAQRMAALFDQYLVYRPDWILDWESGADDHWQAELWRDLVREGAPVHEPRHWAVLQRDFVRAMDAGAPAPGALPACINVFGIPTLSPAYLSLLKAASAHVDVHLYWFNPCREYWADIVTRREAGGRSDGEGHFEQGNSLLANWGRQGRDTLELMQQLEPLETDHFAEHEGDTLLASIQRDILDLENRGDDEGIAWPAEDDASIAIHACHGPMREVEVLHDQLLARFSREPDLEPADVLVMTPDIETYAPLIDAVFRASPESLRIPYTIADRSLRSRSPVIATFAALLELPRSRLGAEYVFGIVEDPSVARRFGLSGEDVATIREWVAEAGARWGFDAEDRARLHMPAGSEHTWRAALDRLVLGYAMPVDVPFAETLPYSNIESAGARALGRFERFVTLLASFSGELDKPRDALAWPRLFDRMIDSLFKPDERDEAALQAVRDALAGFAANAAPVLRERAIGLDVVRDFLLRAIDAPAGGSAFLGGGVTFCAMVPMRSIPFRLVCVIGMNDGAFPRVEARPTLDLMSTKYRVGDRSRREDDRYLFLETLLSARSALYVSYVGRDVRDNSERPPSVVISDLLDYVGQGLVDRGVDREARRRELQQRLVTLHPLQGFDPRYFVDDHRLPAYQSHLADAAAALENGPVGSRSFIDGELSVDTEVLDGTTVEQLVRFFTNPARYLLRNVLDVWLDSRDDVIEDREPFALDWDAAEALRGAWLERYAVNGDVDGCEREMRQKALLPHGAPGRILLEREVVRFERLRPSIQAQLDSPVLAPTEIEFDIGGTRVAGRLLEVRECGMFQLRLRKLQARDRIRFVIEHLAGSIGGVLPNAPSSLVTLDARFMLPPLDAESAVRLLEPWIDAWRQGQVRPLRFFPKAAFAYLDAKDRDKALGRARTAWKGNDYQSGEGDNVYYRKVFAHTDPIDEAFEAAVAKLLAPVHQVIQKG